VVVVVHGSGHVQRHELQGRDEPGQGAVALPLLGAHLGAQQAGGAGAEAVGRVWGRRERQRGPVKRISIGLRNNIIIIKLIKR
jgi:hypothetical protein